MTIFIPRRPARNIEAEYRGFAGASDFHALAGRPGQEDRTIAAIAAIMERMDFAPDHRVLDIGCGDARLLSAIQPVARAVGTVLTNYAVLLRRRTSLA